MNVQQKFRRQKKFNQKKKLKIGYKLQTNLDKNKFGLVKNCAYILFKLKKSVDERGEKELRPTPPSTHTTPFHIHNTTRQKGTW